MTVSERGLFADKGRSQPVTPKRPPGVVFDRKISIVVDRDLPVGKALNVCAHLAFGLGAHSQDALGQQLQDASGTPHKALCRYPIVILAATSQDIKKIIRVAKKDPGLMVVDFPKQALTIWTDEELVKNIKSFNEEDLEYLGVALYGEPKRIDQLTHHLKLWQFKQ